MYKNAVNLYKTLLVMYFGDCNNITNDEKEEVYKKCDPNNLFLKIYKYDKWYKNAEEKGKSQPEETKSERVKLRIQKADDKSLFDTPQIEGDEEKVKEGKRLLTPNKTTN